MRCGAWLASRAKPCGKFSRSRAFTARALSTVAASGSIRTFIAITLMQLPFFSSAPPDSSNWFGQPDCATVRAVSPAASHSKRSTRTARRCRPCPRACDSCDPLVCARCGPPPGRGTPNGWTSGERLSPTRPNCGMMAAMTDAAAPPPRPPRGRRPGGLRLPARGWREPPIRLVVRGDDMGSSQASNEASMPLLRGRRHARRRADGGRALVPQAARLLRENPGLDVGLHLALTSEWDDVKWRPSRARRASWEGRLPPWDDLARPLREGARWRSSHGSWAGSSAGCRRRSSSRDGNPRPDHPLRSHGVPGASGRRSPRW